MTITTIILLTIAAYFWVVTILWARAAVAYRKAERFYLYLDLDAGNEWLLKGGEYETTARRIDIFARLGLR